MTAPTVVLDFDGSVAPVPGELRLPLADWCEAVRFGCGAATLQALARFLDDRLPAVYGTVLTGSGDFHHVSLTLLKRLPRNRPVDVVVLDNHPDNMRFPFGIHCGSWVRRVAMLPVVRHVHVVGITSTDMTLRNAWSHYWQPLLAGRLTYWCAAVDVRWAARLGLGRIFRSFASTAELVDRFTAEVPGRADAVYLSIDKDVLDADECRTNWDQGRMRVDEMLIIVRALQASLVGSDVTGEVSVPTYSTRWKRWLCALDRQPPVLVSDLPAAHRQQAAVNRRLLTTLGQ